jgi:prevent-host-death family protein
MIQAGIKEVKNNLSRLLAKVKAGDEVLITDRGKPVARIVKEQSTKSSVRAALARSIENGLVFMPRRSINRDDLIFHKVEGKTVSEMVVEDRR